MKHDAENARGEEGAPNQASDSKAQQHDSGRSGKVTGKRTSSREEGQPALKRPRKAPSDEEKRAMVLRIETWWRGHMQSGNLTRMLIGEFFSKGISLKTAADISFDQLALKLREATMLEVMQKAVLRVFYLSFGRRGTRRVAEANLNIRVFLAAYMISFRPTFVFEYMGALEKDLQTASIPLLETFERICEQLRDHPIQEIAKELTEEFPSMLHSYVKKFKAWKIPDETKLSERIKHALAALYQAESQLSDDEPENSRLRQEFRAQQERLRYKLLQVAGETVLREFDVQRGKAHLPLPTAEAAAAAGPSSSSSAAASSSTAGGGAAASGNMYASLPGRMTNEQLAHELLLDPNFKLDDKGGSAVENPVFSRIRESFHVAFWDSLVDDLRLSPPCYVRVIRVLSEIRDGIADLASGTKEAASIGQVVDPEKIREQVEAGQLEWGGCEQLVAGIVAVLQRMQAPKRDAETRQRWEEIQGVLGKATEATEERPGAFCKALEFVLDRVNTIRIDAANSRLRMIAPVIKIHGVEYERAHMEKKLKGGQTTLARTEQWLGVAVRRELAAGRVGLGALQEGKAEAFKRVHEGGVLGLVLEEEGVGTESCPETLLLDLQRLQAAHAEFRFGELGATALVLLGQGQERLPAEPMAMVQQWFASHTPRSADPELLHKELLSHLEGQGLGGTHLELVGRVLEKSREEANAVRKLFHGAGGRVGQLWSAAVAAGAVPDSHQIPAVAAMLVPRIEQHALKIRAVTELNLKVHAAQYNRIIADVVKDLGPNPEFARATAPAGGTG